MVDISGVVFFGSVVVFFFEVFVVDGLVVSEVVVVFLEIFVVSFVGFFVGGGGFVRVGFVVSVFVIVEEVGEEIDIDESVVVFSII